MVDPKVLSAYNKISFGKERIVLAGSPQDASGAELRRQWVSTGTCSIEASRFLSAKVKPQGVRARGPGAPTLNAGSASAASTTAFKSGEVYIYYATTGNEIGESAASATRSITITTDGDKVNLLIDHPGTGVNRYFNVYRTPANGGASTAKYIGRVMATAGASQTTFVDLGNKQSGFVTGFLLQKDTFKFFELAPYSQIKLAQTDLSEPKAFFRFLTLAVTEPRKNVLLDNLRG